MLQRAAVFVAFGVESTAEATYSPWLLLLHLTKNPGLARPGTNVAASSIAPAASGK